MDNGKQIYVKISQVSAPAPARRLSQCKQTDEKRYKQKYNNDKQNLYKMIVQPKCISNNYKQCVY